MERSLEINEESPTPKFDNGETGGLNQIRECTWSGALSQNGVGPQAGEPAVNLGHQMGLIAAKPESIILHARQPMADHAHPGRLQGKVTDNHGETHLRTEKHNFKSGMGLKDSGKDKTLKSKAHEDMEEKYIDWYKWRKQVESSLFHYYCQYLNQLDDTGHGCITFYGTVTKEHKLTLRVIKSEGEAAPAMEKALLKSANMLNGTVSLQFPDGTKRTKTTVTRTFSRGSEYGGSEDFEHDVEKILVKRQAQR